jgi:hypothetical protein
MKRIASEPNFDTCVEMFHFFLFSFFTHGGTFQLTCVSTLLTLYHLPVTSVGSSPDRDFGFFHVKKQYLVSLFIVSGSTRVLVCVWNNAQKAPEVFLHQ